MEIKAGVMLSVCSIFHQKSRLDMLINIMLKKKRVPTKLSNIVQNSEEGQVFLDENSVFLNKKVFKSLH